jgi:hypothetical protein
MRRNYLSKWLTANFNRVLSATIYTPTALFFSGFAISGSQFSPDELNRFGYSWLPDWGFPLLFTWGCVGMVSSFGKQENPLAFALFCFGSIFVYFATAIGLHLSGSGTGLWVFACLGLQCLKDLRSESHWVRVRSYRRKVSLERMEDTGLPGFGD